MPEVVADGSWTTSRSPAQTSAARGTSHTVDGWPRTKTTANWSVIFIPKRAKLSRKINPVSILLFVPVFSVPSFTERNDFSDALDRLRVD